MRRALLAVAATVAGLVALLSFRSAGGDQQRPGASGPAADSGPTVSGPTVSGPTVSGTTGAAPSPSLPPLPPGARAVTGRVINTLYGPVQVQVVVKARKILGVNILRRPSATEMDIQIGQYALPQLVAETLAAQSARIDTVSGATYTSGGYINSLQNALDDGA
jgi:hypothetical protein